MAFSVAVASGTVLAIAAGGAWVAGARDRPALASGVERPAATSASADEVLDRRALVFREDEDPTRRIAHVEARLVRTGNAVALRVVASAVGADVDPAPGWEQLARSNRITAEEMTALLDRGEL